MKKSIFYRRLVYIFFVVVFLIVSPLVILYSQGYRYNVQKGLVQKTGILVARSKPSQVNVSIDGHDTGRQTPAKVEDILPGDYEVELTKDGYHSWRKKLTIRDNSTTFADDVILFKKNDPQPIIAAPIVDWLVSYDHIYVGMISSQATGTISIINTATGSVTPLYSGPTGAKLDLLSWSAHNNKLLIAETSSGKTRHLVLNVNELSPVAPDQIKQDYSYLSWGQDNDTIIYGLRSGRVFAYDLASGRENILASNLASSSQFAIYNDQLFSQTDTKLTWSNLTKNGRDQTVDCFDCSIHSPFNNLITVTNQTDNQGAIINPENQKITGVNAIGFDWLANDWLLGYGKWELWTYDRQRDNIDIITRLSTPISTAVWHPSGHHIIFATLDQLNIIELDNRDLRNVITLANVKDITGLTINPRNQTIYFAGTVGDQTGLFKLPLTD